MGLRFVLCEYFIKFKAEVYEFLICFTQMLCYAVKVILNTYRIVIYVNLEIFFQNIY